MNNLSLDMLDRKIMYELDLNSRQPFKKLAKTLRISKETARFRVLRLIEKEYIKNFMTTINISKLNMFYYKLFYKFHKTTTEKDKDIITWIKNVHNLLIALANLDKLFSFPNTSAIS